jgi:hypothetical protein
MQLACPDRRLDGVAVAIADAEDEPVEADPGRADSAIVNGKSRTARTAAPVD